VKNTLDWEENEVSLITFKGKVAVGSGFQAFAEDGKLKDDRQTGMLKATIDEFVKTANRMVN